MKTKVYSAFPGVGKTTYFNTTDKNVLDSDSSKFDKKNFPANYIDHIERNIQDPKVDKILVSSHKDVRDALLKRGIPYVLVYPNRDIKDEYIQRYKDRGNNDAFVDLLNKISFQGQNSFAILDFYVGNNRVIKDLPLTAFSTIAALNPLNKVPEATNDFPSRVGTYLRLRTNIVIPPQIQFKATLRFIGPTGTTLNPVNIKMSVKGYGKLFNPGQNY
jgi:hypothetical protein